MILTMTLLISKGHDPLQFSGPLDSESDDGLKG